MTTVVTGATGSGKTEFCINLALASDKPVLIADLDVVNPYFRPRERASELADKGIEVLGGSLNNNTGQDMPAASYAFMSGIRAGRNVIIDLAGGTLGLNMLAPIAHELKALPHEFWIVLNLCRPETSSIQAAAGFIEAIRGKGPLTLSGIVHNSHMLAHTTPQDFISAQSAIIEISKLCGLPIKYSLLTQKIYDEVKNKLIGGALVMGMPIMREGWQN